MANIITTLSLEMSENWYVSKKINSVGRVGENTVTKLIIEPVEILDATYELEIMSADGSKNVAELTVEDNTLYLILTANMLTVGGITKMQLRAVFEDNSIKKSNIFELKVSRSISATDYYEEYSVTIFDQLVAQCQEIIDGAEGYVERAETAAGNAEDYAESASASATSASNSAQNAATSETNAHNSETAAGNSETNASGYCTRAETAAGNAENSATNAGNSATAANTSAVNAHNSEVAAGNSETNAGNSATEAAASAATVSASVAQINENTWRINDLEAIIGGYTLADLPTGTMASITDGTALLMPSLKVDIEPIQDLNGYDHPWAGGAGINLIHINSRVDETIADVRYTSDDEYLYLNGTKHGGGYASLTSLTITLQAGTYYIKALPISGSGSSVYVYPYDGNINLTRNVLSEEKKLTLDSEKTFYFRFGVFTDGIVFNNYKIGIVISKTANIDKFYPYSNICPISGWTAANVVVSPTTSASDGTTYNVQFTDGTNPLTVYGGNLNVISGLLTVTDAYIASYNGETLPSTWISDRDVYAAGTTPTAGAEVCYTLANSVTYQLTPTQIRTLVGNNNIWADTGNIIEGKYYKSPS